MKNKDKHLAFVVIGGIVYFLKNNVSWSQYFHIFGVIIKV